METTILEWDREVLSCRGRWPFHGAMCAGWLVSASERKIRNTMCRCGGLLDYVDRHISEKAEYGFSINKGISITSMFSQLFKKETGYTFSDYVNMKDADRGERLLEGAGTEEVCRKLWALKA